MSDHRVLQICDKGKGGIGAQIRVNQLNGDRAQLIGIFSISARQATAGIAPNFSHGEIHWIAAIFLFILRPNSLYRLLKRAHLLKRIFPRCSGRHRKVARHGAALWCVEKPPLHVPIDKQHSLAGQGYHHGGKYGVARPNHKSDEGAKHIKLKLIQQVIHEI